MFFNRFAKREAPYPLVVGMTGVKLGDRIAYIGCANGGPLAAVAAKVGLSGRAIAIVPDEASAARAQKAAARQGVLVEVERVAAGARIPLDNDSVDVAIIDDTFGSFSTLTEPERRATIRDLARIVRSGGRVMIIGAAPHQGLQAWLYGHASGLSIAASGEAVGALEADGFKPARVLAEREGMIFVEGVKLQAGEAGKAG